MMHSAERQACEKVFGMLISTKGPLRNQTGLRAQLVNELQRNALLWYHGARLFQLMVQGLPFIPLPPETRTIALRELNRYKSLSLRSDAPLTEDDPADPDAPVCRGLPELVLHRCACARKR